MTTAALIIWSIAFTYYSGLISSLSIIYISLASIGIGSLFVCDKVPARFAYSILSGYALIFGMAGWFLPFQLYYHAVFIILFGSIIVVRWKAIYEMVKDLPAMWKQSTSESGSSAYIAINAIGLMSTFAWLPTLDYDSLAYHLNLPTQLVQLGYYQMNVETNVWALAPWISDLIQGITWIIAGDQSRGAVDGMWAILTLIFIWKLCEEIGLKLSLRWLALAIYASIPLVAYNLGVMQTEGPTSAVIAGLSLLILRTTKPNGKYFLLIAVLFGLLISLKISNLMFVLPLLTLFLWRFRKYIAWRLLPFAAIIFFVVAGSSYVYSYILTGNPVLPLFNSYFKSPYFQNINFHDSRWYTGFRWDIIWRIVFHSGKYIESGDKAPTLALIALAGSFFISTIRSRSRALAGIALLSLLIPLYEIQYIRYALPAMVLIIPAMLFGVQCTDSNNEYSAGVYLALIILIIGNILFLPGASWQTQNGALMARVYNGSDAVVDKFAPISRLSKMIYSRYGAMARTLILDMQSPFSAVFAGRAFTDSWYDPRLEKLVRNANFNGSSKAWDRILKYTGANIVITDKNNKYPGLMDAFKENHGSVIQQTNNLVVWELEAGSSGTQVSTAPNELSVMFHPESSLPEQTLIHAKVKLKCNPGAVQKGHIVVSWEIRQGQFPTATKYAWASCLQNGTALETIRIRAHHKVTGVKFNAVPEPSIDMGIELISSHAWFRHDLSAERDKSTRIRNLVKLKI